MIWKLATLLVTTASYSTATTSVKNVDVIIIGAGAAGAAAAREFKSHNSRKPAHKISYIVFEAQDRVGGRILDIKLGGDKYTNNPTRTSGGFRTSETGTAPPTNVGCHCDETSCPSFQVEVGAGWFTGTEVNLPTAKSCTRSPSATDATVTEKASPTASRRATATASRREIQREEKILEFAPIKQQRAATMKATIADRTRLGTHLHHRDLRGDPLNCKACPRKRYNHMYAYSQNEGEGRGNLKPFLEVNCNELDGQDDNYSFLNSGSYYGYNSEGVIEMRPIENKDRFPSFNKAGDSIKVRAARFIDTFWAMIDKCVDYQAYELFYQYQDSGCDANPRSTPFFYDNLSNISWSEFDVGFDGMPDYEPFWEEPLFYDKKKAWCFNYFELVGSFLNGTTQQDLDASKMYNFYKNFNYFSEFLGGQDMSFGNFGDDGSRAYGYNIAYSIDQRGLKSVVRRIMPGNNIHGKLKLQHEVQTVDWSGESTCPPGRPVKVEVKNLKTNDDLTYCTKKVISTVSLGVLEESNKNIFEPQINMEDSPFQGMGNLVKVYFRFNETFWPNSEYLTYLMEESFRMNTTDRTVKGEYFYNLNHWFKNLCYKNDKYCELNSLFLFLGTPELELMGLHETETSDQKFSDKIWALLDPLREEYGDDYVEPNCWYFQDWNDKYHRGAYGVWKKGKTYCDHIDFFQPRRLNNTASNDKVLYLSGEASCAYLWGFIEGAYEAGSRDAKVIINELMGIDRHVFSDCGLQPYFDQCDLEECKGKGMGNN